jgi:hypothetical protein
MSQKRYYVAFYDAFDGWGSWGFWIDRLFDDLDKAKACADEHQAKLNPQNKDCGEHYGVIDRETGTEIYCTKKR